METCLFPKLYSFPIFILNSITFADSIILYNLTYNYTFLRFHKKLQ